eukprot:1015108-Amphidinium_carterae.1
MLGKACVTGHVERRGRSATRASNGEIRPHAIMIKPKDKRSNQMPRSHFLEREATTTTTTIITVVFYPYDSNYGALANQLQQCTELKPCTKQSSVSLQGVYRGNVLVICQSSTHMKPTTKSGNNAHAADVVVNLKAHPT